MLLREAYIMIKRLIALLLPLSVCFCVSFSAFAAESKTFSAPIVVKSTDQTRTLSGKWNGRLSASREDPKNVILVESGFKGTITLDNLSVELDKASSDYVCAFRIEPGASPTIILKGKNIFTSGNNRAGIEIPKGAWAKIEGGGTVSATGGDYAAGIGGGNGKSLGRISVNKNAAGGGNGVPEITAVGGADAAGIGGGRGGNGGSILINCGLINATGHDNAQHIGFGMGGKPGDTRLYGGRLLNFDRIGWSETDSAGRKEIKFIVPQYDRLIDATIRVADIDYSMNAGDVTLPDKNAEKGVHYVYVPKSLKKLDVQIKFDLIWIHESPFGPGEYKSRSSQQIERNEPIGENNECVLEFTDHTLDYINSVR